MKIGVKITLLIATAFIGIAVVSIMSFSSLRKLDDMFTYMGDVPFKNSVIANEMLSEINTMARSSAMLVVDTNPVEKARRFKNVSENVDHL